jgi:phosphoribosylglycinamide formyltransferase 2
MTAPRVVIVGADGPGAELVSSFERLGAEVTALDGGVDPADVIERVRPDHVVRTADPTDVDREGVRRLAADELGLPTAPFWFAGSVAELTAITDHTGFPLVVTPLAAPPGEGQSVLLRSEDVEPAWQRAGAAGGPGRVLVETVVEIDHELTILTVRGADGVLTFCEAIGHRQVDSGPAAEYDTVLEVWQPQQMSQIAVDAARSIAARVVNALGGQGVFGVELLVRGDEVYFSDVTARPPDTGLVTLRSQRLSMFDLHARATLGLPVDSIMVSPAAAEVVYAGAAAGDAGDAPAGVLVAALGVPESDVRVFPRSAGHQRGPVGVAIATGPDVTTARDRVRQMSGALRQWWS